MGFALWAVECVWAALAAYALAAVVSRGRSALERALVALTAGPAMVLTVSYGCALAHGFATLPVALASFALHGAVLYALARFCDGRAALREALRADLAAPRRLLRETLTTGEPALLACVGALAALGVACVIAGYYRSWTWDCVWYHVPLADFAVQNRSIDWFPTHVPWLNGYPRNLELLAAWNCVLPMDKRLDDVAQLPFCLLGAAAVAAFARRAGASRPLCVAGAAMWIATPAVALQLYTTHVDVACGALFLTAFYFMTQRRCGRRERWLTCLALGLYAGTKFTGIFHGAFVAPWIAARTGAELLRARGRRARLLGDIALCLAAMCWIGGLIYLRNIVRVHNPIFPFRAEIPFLHLALPGTVDQRSIVDPAFWADPGAFEHMVRSWYTMAPFYAPDVRAGGFGLLFQLLGLPCLVIVAADAVRGKDVWNTAPVTALALLSMIVPAAWWPRYTLGVAAAAIIAVLLVRARVRSLLPRLALSLAAAVLSLAGYYRCLPGYIVFPRYFSRMVHGDTAVRYGTQIDSFLWPTAWGVRKERELRRGDVVTYDEGAVFLAEFFTHDYRNRVLYVSSEGDPAAYVRALARVNARWAGVRSGSAAEQALRAAGGVFLFAAPTSDEVLYRTPWATP